MNETQYVIHTDGGARGNPGPAAIGVVILNSKTNERHAWGQRIGECTNNVAEYKALLEALTWIKSTNPSPAEHTYVHCYLDSQLVVSQLNGLYKIKDTTLRQLALAIREVITTTGIQASFHHVPREQNRDADKLVNQALDERCEG